MRYLLRLLFLGVCATAAYAAEPDFKAIKEQVGALLPGVTIDAIRPSNVPGFYELEIANHLAYVSADGKYLLLGDIVDLKTRVNLTEEWRAQTAAKSLDAVGDQNMIVMGPATAKRTITVFTDVDCPYCAKLHLEVPELNKHGVKVRYLLFPRNGINSETYRRSVAVWCAADRVKAVGVAKAGGKVDMKTCSNPVEAHYQLGQRLGVAGTPTIYLDDGKKIGGYVPSGKLLAILGINTVPSTSHAP